MGQATAELVSLAVMSLPLRAAETVGIILAGLLAGLVARRRGMPEALAPRITRFVLIFGEPFPIALSLWGLSSDEPELFLLPALAVALVLAMWPVGHALGRGAGLYGRSLGAFTTSAMFSNVGITYGAFLCYALLGERGAALGFLYCASFMPTFYILGFWVAGRYGTRSQRALTALIDTFNRPESRNPILGVAIGLFLMAAAVPRPGFVAPLIDVLVPLTTLGKLFAIGLSMDLTAMLGYWRPAGLMHVVKFVVSPFVGLALGLAVGLERMGPDLLPVMFIESATPTAIMSLVLAQATDLDVQLANACWLATNLSAVALAPLWLYIASVL